MLNKCAVCGAIATTEWREYDKPPIWTCAKCYPEGKPMSITVIAPAYYPSMNYVRYLDNSARRWNIPIHWYGCNRPYPGWNRVQLGELCDEICNITTTHILYTDGSDVLLNAPLEEITAKYYDMKTPHMVLSVEKDGKVCAGGWLAEKYMACEILTRLISYRPNVPDPDNPQVRWRQALIDGVLPPHIEYSPYQHPEVFQDIELDDGRQIFQVADEPLEVNHGRLYNPRTKSYPCLIHFAGGYTDPVEGKAALIEPYWKGLGY